MMRDDALYVSQIFCVCHYNFHRDDQILQIRVILVNKFTIIMIPKNC